VPTNLVLGEFEQYVLLAILKQEPEAYALSLRALLSEIAGRSVSRGALYRTLDRLADKGFVSWDVEEDAPARGGLPRRRFSVTRRGVAALRTSRRTLLGLWEGLGEVLG
jgi:DNA-binding PadR family transcriptional regulator